MFRHLFIIICRSRSFHYSSLVLCGLFYSQEWLSRGYSIRKPYKELCSKLPAPHTILFCSFIQAPFDTTLRAVIFLCLGHASTNFDLSHSPIQSYHNLGESKRTRTGPCTDNYDNATESPVPTTHIPFSNRGGVCMSCLVLVECLIIFGVTVHNHMPPHIVFAMFKAFESPTYITSRAFENVQPAFESFIHHRWMSLILPWALKVCM